MDRQQAFIELVRTGILLSSPTNSFDALFKALHTLEVACDMPVTMLPGGILADAVTNFLVWGLRGGEKPSWVVE